MLAALVRHVGCDTAARVYPEGPLRPTRPRAQLALTGVDTESVRVEAERLGAFQRSAAAVAATGAADLGSWLAHPGLRAVVQRRWVALLGECERAARFDVLDGARVSAACLRELVDTIGWHDRVTEHGAGDIADDAGGPEVLAAAAGLVERLAVEVSRRGADAFLLDRLVECGLYADRLAIRGAPGTAAVERALDGATDARWGELAAGLLEACARPDARAHALLRLAARGGPTEALEQAAIRWGDTHPEVLVTATQALEARGLAEAAAYWFAEAARMHPGHPAFGTPSSP